METLASLVATIASFLFAPVRWVWKRAVGQAAEERQLVRQANLAAFNGLYKPLYQQLVVDPRPLSPIETFADAENDTLAGYLERAQTLIQGKEEYAHRDLLERMMEWDDAIYMPSRDQLLREAAWMYGHVQDQFEALRRKLHMS
ncbi:MAG: hypothetical protein WEB52_11715 [Dehalococcoidia bacterium]